MEGQVHGPMKTMRALERCRATMASEGCIISMVRTLSCGIGVPCRVTMNMSCRLTSAVIIMFLPGKNFRTPPYKTPVISLSFFYTRQFTVLTPVISQSIWVYRKNDGNNHTSHFQNSQIFIFFTKLEKQM